jgi:hypothetical protein
MAEPAAESASSTAAVHTASRVPQRDGESGLQPVTVNPHDPDSRVPGDPTFGRSSASW